LAGGDGVWARTDMVGGSCGQEQKGSAGGNWEELCATAMKMLAYEDGRVGVSGMAGLLSLSTAGQSSVRHIQWAWLIL
jgi:hypothetical protein